MYNMNVRKRFIFIILFILLNINFGLSNLVYAKESVLLIRPLGKNYSKIEKEFRKKVETHFNIEILPANNYLNTSRIAQKESQINPRAVIIIDTMALAVYKKYRNESATGNSRPAIILLPQLTGSDKSLNLKNSIVINYFVSIHASVKKLEEKLHEKINNVDVIYHSKMINEIRRNMTHSHKNKVYTQSFMVKGSGESLQKELRNKLNEIAAKNTPNVIWIPNDPQLTTPVLIKNLWKPFIEKTDKMSIVQNPSLLASNGGFGTMYIRPDYNEIGRLTGDLVKVMVINNVPVTELNIDNDRFFYCSFAPLPAPIKQTYDTLQPVAAVKDDNINSDTIPKIVKSGDVKVDPKEKTSEDTTANSDPQKEKPLLALSNEIKKEIEQPDTSTTPEDKKNRRDSIKRHDPEAEEDSSLTSVKKSEETKKTEITEKQEKKKKAGTIPDIEADTKIHVKTEEIEPVTEALSGIFLEITDSQAYVLKDLSKESSSLGVAENGERFPIITLDQTGMWYKILFYNDYGWINSNSVKIVKKSPLKKYFEAIFPSLEYIILIGVIAIILFILLFTIIKLSKRKNTTKAPSGNSCMIVTRNFDKIPYSEKKKFSIPLHKFFKKLKFEVTVARDLKTVKETLKYYIPNVICVDWQFEVDIRSDIQKMLPDTSLLSEVIIIFYNAIDSFHFKNEAKFVRTFYFGTSFTLKEIQEIISSLLNGGKKTRTESAKDNYLTGKILNYNLVEIFQLLGTERKSGCLIIERDVPVGLVFFNNRRIVYAITNDLKGEEAVFKILKLKEGMFRFIPDKKPLSTNMDDEIIHVLMKWTASMDREAEAKSSSRKN